MKQRLFYFLASSLFIGSIFVIMYIQQNNTQLPTPINTIIVDGEDEDNHIKKQEWIEMIHRSPHWRKS